MYGYAGFRAAHRARDRYGKLLAAGLTSLILGQAAVNLFAVMGLAPLTGVPLPFVSYGGTSLIVTLAATGLILNVARRPARSAANPRRSSSRATGTQASRPRAPARRARTASGGAAARAGRLRVVEGGTGSRRRSVARGTSGDSGRRDGGARRAGDRRRRRASG